MKITITIDTDYFTPYTDGFNTYHSLFSSLLKFMPRRTQVTDVLIEEWPHTSSTYIEPRDRIVTIR